MNLTERKEAAKKLTARLLTQTEAMAVVGGGGTQPHSQNGSPYTQNVDCPGPGYVQLGGEGPYNQSCFPPGY